MPSNYFWTVVLILGACTVSLRISLIFLSRRFVVTDRMRELLTFIPAAVLPALVVPLVYFDVGKVSLLLGKERLVILVLAGLLSYSGRSMFMTIAFGLATLYIVNNYF